MQVQELTGAARASPGLQVGEQRVDQLTAETAIGDEVPEHALHVRHDLGTGHGAQDPAQRADLIDNGHPRQVEVTRRVALEPGDALDPVAVLLRVLGACRRLADHDAQRPGTVEVVEQTLPALPVGLGTAVAVVGVGAEHSISVRDQAQPGQHRYPSRRPP